MRLVGAVAAISVADGNDAINAFDTSRSHAYGVRWTAPPAEPVTRRLTMAAPITATTTTETWAEALAASRDRVLAATGAGRYRAALLAHATAGRIVAAWTLDPAPRDPATHLEATHARCRRHLQRLVEKPAGDEIRSPMTNQLYTRLTQPTDPARPTRVDYTVVEA